MNIRGHSFRSCKQAAATAVMVFAMTVPVSCEPAQKGESTMTTPRPTEKKVLKSALAGRWYSADADTLRREIEASLIKADTPARNHVIGLILPHAGYMYSGQTAAYGLQAAAGTDYSRIIIMGPTHRVPMQNFTSIPDVTHIQTPLGDVPLDLECIHRLKETPYFKTVPQAHQGEHSVQIEIPLLQTVFTNFKLVPIVVGQIDPPTMKEIANVLTSELDENTLVVVSTDFTHYGDSFQYTPFSTNIKEQLHTLDMGAFDTIKNKDADAFHRYVERSGATICGRCPVGIFLNMLSDNAEVKLVRYDTSGELTGDFRNSVSYVAATVQGRWNSSEKRNQTESSAANDLLSNEDKKQLLKLARQTLQFALTHKRPPEPDELDVEVTDGMQRVMGAFVTLEKNHQLRGCIGEIFPRRELYKAVIDHAVNAAFNDYRFQPVTAPEEPSIHIEISALQPPYPIERWQDIKLGKHGIVLRKGRHQAVFLPQVAPEQGWTVEETLTHLAVKAGLPADAWEHNTEFYVFEAIVFEEE